MPEYESTISFNNTNCVRHLNRGFFKASSKAFTIFSIPFDLYPDPCSTKQKSVVQNEPKYSFLFSKCYWLTGRREMQQPKNACRRPSYGWLEKHSDRGWPVALDNWIWVLLEQRSFCKAGNICKRDTCYAVFRNLTGVIVYVSINYRLCVARAFVVPSKKNWPKLLLNIISSFWV